MVPKFNQTFAPYIIYPLNGEKWDDRMSAAIPNEDVFYILGLLHSTQSDEYQVIDELNDEIMARCKTADIQVKQYLPHYKTKQDWIKHFGAKWNNFRRRKAKFDPNMILSPGQRIFN